MRRKFRLEIKKTASKKIEEIYKSDKKLYLNMTEVIASIESSPFEEAVKLSGFQDTWRKRCRHYRIIYVIDAKNKIITITRIAKREDAYE